MSIISKKFSEKITTMKNEFEINKDVEHQGTKGSLNENELATLIKDVIPQKYKMSKGIIENADGIQSNETDIIIYDDEILPIYMKNDLAFVPVEAVKYNFEVKSILNSTELQTTISKFEKFKSIGGSSPTVLFSFSSDIQGSELSRLKKNDDNFFTNPAISVLCTSNKSYYFYTVTEHYIKDYISNLDFIQLFSTATGLDINEPADVMEKMIKDDDFLSKMTRSEFALLIQCVIQINKHRNDMGDKELTINEIKYNDIKFKIHKWYGLETESNEIELSFLSGISNTLSKGNFGNYLLSSTVKSHKLFSVCYEDMWGNLSCKDFNENGIDYDSDTVSIKFKFNKDANQIIFTISK